MQNKNLFIIGIIVLVGLAFLFGRKINFVLTSREEPSVALTLLGKQAPDFSLTTLDRQPFKLADKKGKVVILFGMAGWCGTCIPEGRALTKIRQEYASKGVEIIGVAFTKGDNEDFLKEFSQLGTIDIPLALDTDNIASKYQLIRLETTYIINKDGIAVYKDEGYTSHEDYKRELDKVI